MNDGNVKLKESATVIIEQVKTHGKQWYQPDAKPIDGETPYKGLQSYKKEDAHLFFGRDALTAQLHERIESEWVTKRVDVWGKLLAIVGASGSGKSSLVRAGLLPLLKADGWPIYVMRPHAHPLEELAEVIRDAETETDKLIAEMRQSDRALHRTVRRLVGSDGRLLLVIDQFEETFTLCCEDGRGGVHGTHTREADDCAEHLPMADRIG